MKKNAINKQSLVNLVWIMPWLVVPAFFFQSRLRRDPTIVPIAGLVFFLGILSALHTNSISIVVNCFAIAVWVLTVGPRKSFAPSLGFASVYIIGGTLVSVVLWFSTGDRLGLYGGEANFSGFLTVMFLILALQRKEKRTMALIFVCLLALISASRALLVSAFFSLVFFGFRNRPLVSILLFLFIIGTYFSAADILRTYEHLSVFRASGYIPGISRLSVINDSSTSERMLLNELWWDAWTATAKDFLLGIPSESIVRDLAAGIGKVPHNSFIQKGADFGFLFLIVFFVFLFSSVPLWVALTILFYGLFLHNLFSVPWVLAMSVFLNPSSGSSLRTRPSS